MSTEKVKLNDMPPPAYPGTEHPGPPPTPQYGYGQPMAAGYAYPPQPQGQGQMPAGHSYPPHPPQGEGQMPAGYVYPPPPQGQGPYYHPQQGYGPVPGGQGYNYQGAPQNQVTVVSVQPQSRNAIITQTRPTNWLGPAILATLCCFCPTGICAIVSAVNANSAADRGDYEDAHRKALTARNLTLGTVACGIVLFIVVAMLRTFLFANTYNSSLYDY